MVGTVIAVLNVLQIFYSATEILLLQIQKMKAAVMFMRTGTTLTKNVILQLKEKFIRYISKDKVFQKVLIKI